MCVRHAMGSFGAWHCPADWYGC